MAPPRIIETETDRPPNDPLVREVDLLHSKMDAIISDTRGSRLHREKTDRTLDAHGKALEAQGKKLVELADGQASLERGIMEVLKEVKGARDEAGRAKREASAALEKSSRASWSDDIALEAAKTGLDISARKGREEIEEKRIATKTRNRIIYGVAAAAVLIVQTGALALIAHGWK